MSYEHLEESVFSILRRYWSRREYIDPQGKRRTAEPRVIFLDAETAPFEDSDILTNERILAIAVAKRVSGNFMSNTGIEVKSWLLKDDSDQDEYRLLENFNDALRPEPLAVLGYGIKDYDLPLLSIKMKRYDPDIMDVKLRFPFVKKLWHIINMLERAVHLDLMTRLRFKFKKRGFDEIIDHPAFQNMPLRRIKHPVPPEGASRGRYMYRLWKEKRESVKELVESHVHDLLLVAERCFSIKEQI